MKDICLIVFVIILFLLRLSDNVRKFIINHLLMPVAIMINKIYEFLERIVNR